MELQANTIYIQLNCNGFIGIIPELPQAYLATSDTDAQPFVYTGSGNIDTTNNQLSLDFPIKKKQRNRVKPKSIRECCV